MKRPSYIRKDGKRVGKGLPKAQKGKVQPYQSKSLDDYNYRKQMYKDSLALHNFSEFQAANELDQKSVLDNIVDIGFGFLPVHRGERDYSKRVFDYAKNLVKNNPRIKIGLPSVKPGVTEEDYKREGSTDVYHDIIKPAALWIGDAVNAFYKKPVQEVLPPVPAEVKKDTQTKNKSTKKVSKKPVQSVKYKKEEQEKTREYTDPIEYQKALQAYKDSSSLYNSTNKLINKIKELNLDYTAGNINPNTILPELNEVAQLQATNRKVRKSNPLYDHRGNIIGYSPVSQLSRSSDYIQPIQETTLYTPGQYFPKQPWAVQKYKKPIVKPVFSPFAKQEESPKGNIEKIKKATLEKYLKETPKKDLNTGWIKKYHGDYMRFQADPNFETYIDNSSPWLGPQYYVREKKKHGGSFMALPKAQKGIREPIYVEDPNDPRLKAYQDSMALVKGPTEAYKIAQIIDKLIQQGNFNKAQKLLNQGYSQMTYPDANYTFPKQYVTDYPNHKVFETEEDFNKDRLLQIRNKYWPTKNTKSFDTGFDVPNNTSGPGPVRMPNVKSNYQGIAMMYGGDPSLPNITGHFKTGGLFKALPKAQQGIDEPIFVEDPNDPRLRAYTDSLNLYRLSNRFARNDYHFDPTYIFPSNPRYGSEYLVPYSPTGMMERFGVIEPIGIGSWRDEVLKSLSRRIKPLGYTWSDVAIPVYKKPSKKVKLKEKTVKEEPKVNVQVVTEKYAEPKLLPLELSKEELLNKKAARIEKETPDNFRELTKYYGNDDKLIGVKTYYTKQGRVSLAATPEFMTTKKTGGAIHYKRKDGSSIHMMKKGGTLPKAQVGTEQQPIELEEVTVTPKQIYPTQFLSPKVREVMANQKPQPQLSKSYKTEEQAKADKARGNYIENPTFMDYVGQAGYMPYAFLHDPFSMGEMLKQARTISSDPNLNAYGRVKKGLDEIVNPTLPQTLINLAIGEGIGGLASGIIKRAIPAPQMMSNLFGKLPKNYAQSVGPDWIPRNPAWGHL